MKAFRIHWILNNKLILLPKNNLNQLPRIGDELRASDNSVYEVLNMCWCLDEDDSLGQRVNIGIKKLKL